MKLITFSILTLITIIPLLAQDLSLQWVHQMGSTTRDSGGHMAIDNSGNIYTIGFFTDTVDFDPGTGVFNLISNGEKDIFIQKSDANGHFIWVKQIGGSSIDESWAITLDDEGHIYTTGWFRDTVDFDPGIDSFNLISNGMSDIFIQKLDSDGNFIWVKHFGSSSSDSGQSIKLDTAGNIYVTGGFSLNVDFDPGIDIHYLYSSYDDTFILKLDSNGNFIWAKQTYGGTSDIAMGKSISVDQFGNVYSIGRFYGTMSFEPGIGGFSLTSVQQSDIFIIKYDSSGNFLWAKQLGGDSYNECWAAEVDNNGNIYLTGWFYENQDMDPGPSLTNFISTGQSDGFIQKLNTNGDLVWAKQLTGPLITSGHAITLDDFGNIYTTGHFMGTVDFDPSSDTVSLTALGDRDVYIHKLDSNGDFVWVKQFGGTSEVSTWALQTDHYGNIYNTGLFKEIVDFDPNLNIENLTSTGSDDIYILKLYQCDNTLIPDSSTLPTLNSICSLLTPPIPVASNGCNTSIQGQSNIAFPIIDQSISEIIWTFDDGFGNLSTQTQAIDWTPLNITTSLNGFTITANQTNATYQWLNCNNNYTPISGENNIDFTATTNGSYAVEITQNDCIDTTVCVTIENISINEFNNISLVIYPNPSSDMFNITFDKDIEQAEIRITNILGQTIFKNHINQTTNTKINLKNQPSGLYILSIITKNQQKTMELIKE